ncbi:MAG: DUF3352 domain-containing protein [Thermomicrobiales bacterium]
MLTTTERPTQRHRGLSLALVSLLSVSMLFSALISGSNPARAAQGSTLADTTADLTPATALAYISVNLDQKSDQWTLSTELLKRAGLTEALNESGLDNGSVESATDEADAFLGGHAAFVLSTLPMDDSFNLDAITGEVSGAMTDPGTVANGDVPSGFAVIIESPDPDAAQTQLEAMIEKDAQNNGSTVDTETYGGVEISSIAGTDADSAGTAVARVGDAVVLATLPTDIHPIIDTANGDVDKLSDDAAFKTLKSGLNADWLSFGMVNGSTLLDQLREQDPEVFAEVPASSIAQMDMVSGYVLWADQPGFRIDTLSLPGAGAESATAQEPLRNDFASKVSGDTLYFANSSNINQYGILDTVGLIFAQALVGDSMDLATPGATPISLDESSAQIFAQAANVLGFNIKTDFIDQLTGEFGVAVSASDLTGSNPNISAIFVSDTEDATKVTDVASKISFILASALGGDVLSSRDVNGSSITSIDLSGTGVAAALEFGVVDGQLLIGTDSGINDYVNGPTDSLADNKVYQDTMAELPAAATGITFLNVQGLMPLIDEATSSLGDMSTTLDNSPDCAQFSSQEEAQAAYDEDQFANFDLDRDFDGTACEDFFASSTPEVAASPASATSSIHVQAVGTVSYVKDGMSATSTIVLIGE